MSDTAPGPGTTSSRVRLPIDDVIDRVEANALNCYDPDQLLAYLAAQTPYVLAGVLRKHRAERGAA